ncbi:equilibrative nucleoside transporter 1 isoform X2 [Trichosurus vulpecula]|uniref:equilibrative nucleoside transporter 1 isoform X2 n=1 Tax=Trichosurus vulpecula TaxID=9337 RepID=UPI00186B04AD|nr:equilibrative nucleoside transporter 1 isoform X2 [Trichosurus vulpecula]
MCSQDRHRAAISPRTGDHSGIWMYRIGIDIEEALAIDLIKVDFDLSEGWLLARHCSHTVVAQREGQSLASQGTLLIISSTEEAMHMDDSLLIGSRAHTLHSVFSEQSPWDNAFGQVTHLLRAGFHSLHQMEAIPPASPPAGLQRTTSSQTSRRTGILRRSCKFDTSALSHTSSWLVLLSSIYFWGETEAQKGEGTCPSSQKQGTQELEGTSVGGDNCAKSGEGGMSKSSTHERPSIIAILKQIWVLALSVCFVFTVTIGVFPSVTAEVQSTIAGTSDWNKYFIPVSCFFTFNVFDWAGRSLTTVYMWPKKESRWLLPSLVVARIVFVPLMMLCNVHPRKNLPVVFHHDAWFIIFMIFFAFSNGYLASLCMCFGPKKVKPFEAETAGTIMAFFLSLGLALGALLSFGLRAIV